MWASVVVLLLAPTAAAHPLRTWIFLGAKNVGYIERYEFGGWYVGSGACNDWIVPQSAGQLISGEGSAKNVFARLQRVSPTRWDHYNRTGESKPVWRRDGYVSRINSTTWNAYVGTRRIGYVRGRDGAAAAMALLDHRSPDLLVCLK